MQLRGPHRRHSLSPRCPGGEGRGARGGWGADCSAPDAAGQAGAPRGRCPAAVCRPREWPRAARAAGAHPSTDTAGDELGRSEPPAQAPASARAAPSLPALLPVASGAPGTPESGKPSDSARLPNAEHAETSSDGNKTQGPCPAAGVGSGGAHSLCHDASHVVGVQGRVLLLLLRRSVHGQELSTRRSRCHSHGARGAPASPAPP